MDVLLGICQSFSKRLSLKGASKNQLNVNEIPTDLLESIFSYLDVKDLARTSLVCKQWSEISQNDRLWKNLVKKTIPGKAEFLLPECESSHQKVKEFYSPSVQKVFFALSFPDKTTELSGDFSERLFPESTIEFLQSPVRKTEEKVKRLAKDLDAPRDTLNDSPILIDLSSASDELLPQMDLVLKAGANPNISHLREDSELTTPLHVASFYGSVGQVKLLLDHGAKLDVPTRKGNSVKQVVGLGLSNNPFTQKIREKRRTTILELLDSKI